VDVSLKPIERLLFQTELVLFAEFACSPDEPLFPDSGPSNADCIVFPSTSTRILRRGRPAVLENPTAVSLLNQGEEYRSEVISEEGARVTWFTLADATLAELFHDARSRDIRFREPQVQVSPSTILRHRRLLARLRRGGADPLSIEEQLIGLAREVIASPASRSSRGGKREKLVHRAIEFLLLHFAAPLSLADLARHAGASAAYLSRVFHATAGMTMTTFRHRLRLVTSLDLLAAYPRNVTDLALDLGYSSHSHFTSAFRELFEVSPTRFLRELAYAPAELRSRLRSRRRSEQ
jgi:AraC-like DNA-binding protein